MLNFLGIDFSGGVVLFNQFLYQTKKEFNRNNANMIILGTSGSGKSTIANLIPRLYDVCNGTITFDGEDVRDIDLTWLREQIGIVSQETYLFNGTIRENLLYAKPDATDEELMEACEKANIADFILNQEKTTKLNKNMENFYCLMRNLLLN